MNLLTTKILKKALLAILAAHSCAIGGTALRAQNMVRNIASAQWEVQGRQVTVRSNEVAIQTVAPIVRPEISTYRFGTGPGSITAPLAPTQCTGVTGPQVLTPRGAFADVTTNPASLRPETAFVAGEPVVFGIIAATANKDVAVIETLDVLVTTANGDREMVTLTENAANGGQFFGMLNTRRIPPALQRGDCTLSVQPGTTISLTVTSTSDASLTATANISFMVDPYGVTFDSGDGTPVTGTTIALVDAATGQPAAVYGDDGVSRYPSTIVTGQTVTDSSGAVYTFPEGDYRFPFVAPGSYRLVVTPPAPFTAPSHATPGELADFRRADNGDPYEISNGSYGQIFVLNNPAPVRIDIPLDRPGLPLTIRKTASTTTAVPGDVVQYRITVTNADARRSTGQITISDDLPQSMRLRANSVRFNGTPVTSTVSADGRQFKVVVPALPAGQSGLLTYLAQVRHDALVGDAINLASARDNRGSMSNPADAAIRIVRDEISEKLTIIGRISEGGCTIDPSKSAGIAGVRVMLQDGAYTVTDSEGRYHFEGVHPGLHVVQIDPSTLPLDREAVDCAKNTRSAGNAISRFVEGRGGDLKRADFRAVARAPREAAIETAPTRDKPASDPEAAGANRDWFSGQSAGVEWLFPEPDHNPRTKAVRVAIKHLPSQRVELFVNGKAVPPVAFDGSRKSADNSFAVSLWRGIEIGDNETKMSTRILDANGALVQELSRTVYYSVAPMHAQLVREKSLLVADGVTRPVIAVRLTDRSGRPAKHNLVGDYSVPAPYYPAIEADTQQARQISGLERARAVWHVEGDDGIAYIELEPTTASGSLPVTFNFKDGEVSRTQTVDMWLDPGNRPWTVVGFAAGTVGYNTLDDRMEALAGKVDDLNTDARLALYAKGRVQGKWLMTLAYDSDKDTSNKRLQGVINPSAYYTIYAGKSQTRYDAASVRKLYLRLERPQFYALFGDYDTNMGETQFTSYQRALNGAKAEYRGRNVAVSAFAADTPFRSNREEIQGSGLSGPYPLARRDILANSERITIETRDRLHSERIVQEVVMMRHVDYDIDYRAGTLRFRAPVLSRDSDLNPQFIVATYEVDGVGNRALNAGGRASWTSDDEKLRIGASAIHDENDMAKTNLGGVDVRYRPNVSTEVRAEFALSDATGKASGTDDNRATAWLIEAEHHSRQFDMLAYVRERESGFGVGQLNRSEDATRKFGFDGRVRINPDFSLAASGWQEDFLDTGMQRRAGRLLGEYRRGGSSLRAGLTYARDRIADGSIRESTLVQIGGSQRLLDNKLELDAQTEFALGGKDDSIDFPARHRIGARYAVSQDVNLVASYEIAKGDSVKARTFRAGFDLKPWAGARFTASGNQQNIQEYGPRTYAAFGLAQSVQLSKELTADFTIDANKTLNGFDSAAVMNPDHPVASGGHLGANGLIAEDFIAVTAGATYRTERWTMTGRAEYRNGEETDRYGLTIGTLRRIGEGRNVGAMFTFARAEAKDGGPSTQATNLQMSWANRPERSRWSWLNKLELREDKVWNAIAGAPGPIGGPNLLVDGDHRSRRIVNSLSVNLTPIDERDMYGSIERGEYSFFWGARYVSDRFGTDDIEGFSNLFGADLRFDVSNMIEIGAAGTVRMAGWGDQATFSGGPAVGITPFKNAWLSLGYNFTGYRDQDFEDARYTRSGAYATFRLKLDQSSLAGLGFNQ